MLAGQPADEINSRLRM